MYESGLFEDGLFEAGIFEEVEGIVIDWVFEDGPF